MQPFQYGLRCPAAKNNSITHAAAAPSNLDATITLRSPDTELQNTIELRATGSRHQSKKNTILKHCLNGILKGSSPAPKLKNLLTNHNRSLDAATPIRSTMPSCKRQ